MKTLKIIFTLIVILNISSCGDLLEEEPKTFVSPANFFKSFNDFETAVKGVYGIARNITGGSRSELKEVFADYNDTPESAEQTGDIYANNPGSFFWSIRTSWSIPYQVISNANQILESLDKAPLSEAQKTAIAAETKLLRAYAYFNLVQLYGDVPLRTKPVKSVAEAQIKRTPQAEVYKLIIKDLKEAEADLPSASIQEGRVNSFVAKALLARVYLTTAGNPMKITANYALAKNKALEVIAGPYKLQEDYAKVFKNKAYTSESIWEVLYLDGRSSNGKHNQTAPTGNQTAVLLPSEAFINSFPKGDRRKEWGIKDKFTTSDGTAFIKRTYYNKFTDERKLEQKLAPASTQTDFSFPLIRLAEMYLIAAEAENEVSGPGGAYTYINELRKRARVDKDDATHVPDLSGLSKVQFREAVWQERKWELFTEEHAWFDLKRTNSFDKVQKARGAALAVPIGSYNQTWILPDFEVLNNNIPDNPSYGGGAK